MSKVKLFTKGITLEPQSSDPSSPVEGQLQYADGTARTEGMWVYKNSSWTQVGSGGSGGIDFLLLGDAESGTTGWNSYKDAAASLPVDGTGGSITGGHTFTQSSSSPLNGTNSFILAKPASDCQGEGYSKDITIPLGYATRTIVWSGIYSTDANYVDDDYIVYFYDVTNSALIQPVPYLLKANSYGTIRAEMQVPASCTSLRAIIHCATTSATTRSIKFDDMTIGPSKSARGVTVSDWVSYTPTGTWSTNTTYSGRYKRVGDSLDLDIYIITSGAPTSASLTVNLPSGFTIDTAKLATPTDTLHKFGLVHIRDSGTDSYIGYARYSTTTSLAIMKDDGDGTESAVTQAAPITFGANDYLNIRATNIPIVGWSSNQVVSEDFGTRELFCEVYKSADQSLSDNSIAKITFNTVVKDTASLFDDTNDRFYVREAKTHYITGTVEFNANTNGDLCRVEIYKNGSPYRRASGDAETGNGSSSADINFYIPLPNVIAGDYFEVYALSDTSDSSSRNINSGSDRTRVSFGAIGNNQQIAASEIIIASYESNTASAVTHGNTIVLEDIILDTHSAYNASTGIFTCPISGTYEVTCNLFTGTVSATVGNIFNVSMVQAGSVSKTVSGLFDYCQNTSARGYNSQGTAIFKCIAGDTLKLVYNEDIPAVNLSGNAGQNYVKFERKGGVA